MLTQSSGVKERPNFAIVVFGGIFATVGVVLMPAGIASAVKGGGLSSIVVAGCGLVALIIGFLCLGKYALIDPPDTK